jgi:hypothetical protein
VRLYLPEEKGRVVGQSGERSKVRGVAPETPPRAEPPAFAGAGSWNPLPGAVGTGGGTAGAHSRVGTGRAAGVDLCEGNGGEVASGRGFRTPGHGTFVKRTAG